MVAFIGDVDKDGRQDLAIADRGKSEVFIYKGRQTWPAALGPGDADYVISGDASYTNGFFGFSMAKLGDFNGDGVDDFAIGAPQYSTFSWSSPRRPWQAAGFGNISLPDTANTITIDGDTAVADEALGYRVLGLGHLIAGGTTLIASGPGTVGAATGLEGRIYAFNGHTGAGLSIPIASASAVVVGPGATSRIGIVLANLGPMLNALPDLGSGNVTDTTGIPGVHGTVSLFSGDPTAPFASDKLAYESTLFFNSGEVVIGGGVSGTDGSLPAHWKLDPGPHRRRSALADVRHRRWRRREGDSLPGLIRGPRARCRFLSPLGGGRQGKARGGYLGSERRWAP